MSDQRYVVIVEDAGDNYSAYSPDLPGCVATGATVDETKTRMREAMTFHLEGVAEDGGAIPTSQAVDVSIETVAAPESKAARPS